MMDLDEIIEYMTIPGFETGASNWRDPEFGSRVWNITWETWHNGSKYGFVMKISEVVMLDDLYRLQHLGLKRDWAMHYGQELLDRIA